MAGNGCKWLNMDENVNCQKCLEITESGWIDWKWLEMTGNRWDGWKWLEMAENG